MTQRAHECEMANLTPQKTDYQRWTIGSEGQSFERKSALDRSHVCPRPRPVEDVARDIVEALSSMANADGGVLVVGVEDDGMLSGVPHTGDELHLLEHAPADATYISPPLPARVVRQHTGAGVLLRFEVDVSSRVHRLADGRYLLRVRDSNMPWPMDQIAALKVAKAQGLVESTCPPGATFDDLDVALIRRISLRMRSEGDCAGLLAAYGLGQITCGGLVPNMAGLLLFAREPERWHPCCGLDIIRWEGVEREYGRAPDITERFQARGPLVSLIESVFEVVKPFIHERQDRHDRIFRERLEYPTFAWQQAIVNAVAHRDYSLFGSHVEVHLYDDRMDVRSPGLPLAPVTFEALNRAENRHLSRNPLIARVLTDFVYQRVLGEGVRRMFAEMAQEGLYPPRFQKVGGVTFVVTLWNQPVGDAVMLQWLAGDVDMELSDDQKRLLAWACMHENRFTRRQAQTLFKLDRQRASNAIQALLRKRIARRLRKGGRVYEVISRSRKTDRPSGFQTLLPVLKRHGTIANRDIRELLGVDRHKAFRMAREWVERGLLTREGETRGVVYRRP